MSPDYIGPATPAQLVEIRLGRFSRYVAEGNFPSGAGHQHWNETDPHGDGSPPSVRNFARVGREKAEKGEPANPNYFKPWQALWIPVTAYATIPNVASVKLDKKLEIGGVQSASIEVENIVYPDAGGYHRRERGYLSPLRGYFAHGDSGAPDIPRLLGELAEIIATNEWEGRFSYAAQIKIHQGYGTATAKTFTGLIEDIDSTSHPDHIVIQARDFGLVFTDEHFFGWNKDPQINGTGSSAVNFVDRLEASAKQFIGYNAHASNEDIVGKHTADKVLDFDETTWWQTNLVHSAEQTEYVEIALKEGAYKFMDVAMKFAGMEVFVALRPAETRSGPPSRNGVPLTGAWLDAKGWVDVTKKEEQIVPGVNGGNSYTQIQEAFPLGQRSIYFDGTGAEYVVGDNSVLRLSFRKLHKEGAGENFRAGVKELHAMKETLEAGAGRQGWVVTEDYADVVRTICQWAGFKEWDIPDTGVRQPTRIVCAQGEAYLDVIKRVAEAVGFNFYMADPSPDGGPLEAFGGSLGIPTFRKTKVIDNDMEAIPTITDRSLLTAINVKQSNAPLAYVIRVYGRTLTRPGEPNLAINQGKRLVYTFRPPWTGTPPTYADSRLAGVLKQDTYHNVYFATLEECREAAWLIALREALASIEATIEFPAYPGLDIEDHALLMDLGTGVTTRIAVASRTSTFTDGERRKWTMQVTGPLIDTPDVRDMVNIINGVTVANGAGGEWSDPRVGTGSSLGYG